MKSSKTPKNSKKRIARRIEKQIGPNTKMPASLVRAVMANGTAHEFPDGREFDQLMRYVIFTMSPDHPVYRDHPLTSDEINVIKKACAEKPGWKRLFSDLCSEYNTLLRIFEESAFGEIAPPVTQKSVRPGWIEWLRDFFAPPLPLPRLAAAFALVLFACIGILAGASSVVTPSYFSAASIEPASFSVRGESTVLSAGVDALQRKDYDAALTEFQNIARWKPGSDEALLAGYFEASVYLSTARHSLLGLFPSFDGGKVDAAIADLGSLLSRIQGDNRYRSLEEQSRFMLGQAWLMKKNVVKARQEFEQVAGFQGVKRMQSQQYLSVLPRE